MNDAISFTKGFFSGFPFLSPALETDKFGEYRLKIDKLNAFSRGAIFFASSMALSTFAISYMASVNSSLVFTASLSFATPVAIVAGCLALGILGYKLDRMLTNRAATNLAVQEYLNNAYPSSEALDWLIADTGRIKLLFNHKNIDLSKTDYSGKSLLGLAAKSGNLEIFTLLWEHAKDQNKSEIFFSCVDNLQDSNWGEECLKIVDYMVDTKQISAVMFTEKEQYMIQNEPLRGHLKWTEDHLKWLQKLVNLGFSIDAGGIRSTRYKMSENIFSVALDHAVGRPSHVQNDIFAAMRFLQKNSNREASAVLEGNVWHKDMLEAIAPCLVATESALRQAFHDDNVTIGNLLWDKSDPEGDRKNIFISLLLAKDNSKLANSLIEDGKVYANMFTKEEQCNIFWSYRDFVYIDEYFEKRLNKLIDFGFDIRAKSGFGIRGLNIREENQGDKTIRDKLIEAIAFFSLNVEYNKSYIKSLESVDKILEKQAIATAVVLKRGQVWDDANESYLKMFPDDILNYIVQTMVATH